MTALLGIKDYVYGIIIVALLAGFGWYTIHERNIGKAHEAAVIAAESSKAQAAADKQIDDLNMKWHDAVTQIQEKQSEQLKAAAADSASLSQRLRQYEAASRCPGPVLPGAAAAGSAAAGSAGRPGAVEASLEQLIAAAEHDNAVIQAERAERDSLTGK